jgi:Ca2+-binding EF-hand superfamily protein
VFKTLDADANGSLSAAELCQALKVLQVEVSEIEMQGVMSRFDGDGNRQIEYGEFLRLIGM